MQASTVYLDKDLETGQMMVWCAFYWFSFESSQSSRAGMPEGQRLYLLMLVPRIPIQKNAYYLQAT